MLTRMMGCPGDVSSSSHTIRTCEVSCALLSPGSLHMVDDESRRSGDLPRGLTTVLITSMRSH